MSEYIVMPKEDWQAALDATRAKTGKSDLIKSGELAAEIEGISGGGGGESGGTASLASLIDKSITEVSDSTVTSVGKYAFYGCDALTTANLPNAKSVGENAFSYCKNLEEANIPKAESLDNQAFYNTALKTAHFPNLTSLGRSVFGSCKALRTVFIPKVTTIGYYTFQSCILPSIDFPNVETLESGAFNSCSATWADFTKLSLIKSSAFTMCSNLSFVIIRNETVCSLEDSNAFSGTPFSHIKKTGTLVVPRALTAEYPNDTNWSAVLAWEGPNRVLAIEDYTVDGTITGAIDWDKLNAA